MKRKLSYFSYLFHIQLLIFEAFDEQEIHSFVALSECHFEDYSTWLVTGVYPKKIPREEFIGGLEFSTKNSTKLKKIWK